jgi:choline dehydrogenase-like flavoprotein
MDSAKHYDVIIIGAGAGGATLAERARPDRPATAALRETL